MLRDFFTWSNYIYAFPTWPPVIVGTCIAILGLAALVRERFSRISRSFAWLSLSSALWLVCFGGIYSALTPTLAMQWIRLETIALTLIPSALLCFTLYLVKRYARYTLAVQMAWSLSIFFALFALKTDKLVSGMRVFAWGAYPHYGPLGSVFIVFFTLACAACLALLWQAYHRASVALERDQMRSFFIAFAIGFLGGIDFLACYGVNVYPIGYLPAYACLLLLAQVIWRYRFADLTPAFAATEIMATMPDALVVLDRGGAVGLVNKAAVQLFERPESSLVGMDIGGLIGKPIGSEILEKLLRGGSVRDYEFLFSKDESPAKVISLSASTIRDTTEQPIAFVCVVQDITDRKQAEDKMRDSEKRFRLLVEGVKDYAIYLLDLAGHVISWNEGAERITGYQHTEIVGEHFSKFYPMAEALKGKPQEQLNAAIEEGRTELEGWRVRRDGSMYWADVVATALRDPSGRVYGFVEITRDITEQKRTEEALRASETKFRRLVDSNIIGFMLVNMRGKVLEANDAFLKMLAYTRDDLAAGKIGGDTMTPPEYRYVDEWMSKRLELSGVCPPIEKEYVRRDGSRIPVLVGVVLLDKLSGQCLCFVIDASERRAAQEALLKAYDGMETHVQERTTELKREITKRERAEEALKHLTITDSLTGLYNRRGFLALSQQHLELGRRGTHDLLVFMGDLDDLKGINDTSGHSAGDQAISAAADVLRATFRSSDVIARVGGDEFAVVAIEDGEQTAERLLQRLAQRLEEQNQKGLYPFRLGISMGWTRLRPKETESLEDLMQTADQMLYQQKKKKKGSERRKAG
jgi:diguanylate cyclase (GGDEF)-like protein/PAS domain S-box-containing protein